MMFWPPDDDYMCSKHIDALNRFIVKQDFVHQVGLLLRVLSQPVHETATYGFDSSSDCVKQF